MFRLSAAKLVILAAVFLAAGAVSAAVSGSYLTIPWRIRSCDLSPPAAGLTLADCASVSTKFYYSGSLYVGVEKSLIESLAKADVVIVGNSRTQRSFATKAVDEYFKRKGLRYFILGSEGSGFRFNMLMLERLNIRPKIFLINNEIFFVDILEDANKSIVLDPEQFAPTMSLFYRTKQIVQPICSSGFALLKDFYCHGTERSNWRDPVTGALYIDYNEEGLKRIPLKEIPETRLHYFDRFMKNARIFVGSSSVSGSCRINYIVPSLDSSVELARKMADAMNAPFVFPPIRDYDTFDGSHLWPEASERRQRTFCGRWRGARYQPVDRRDGSAAVKHHVPERSRIGRSLGAGLRRHGMGRLEGISRQRMAHLIEFITGCIQKLVASDCVSVRISDAEQA